MKEYLLKPIMTRRTLNRASTADKPVVARPVPPRQPLPTATIDATKPLLKLGLDVHPEFTMVVSQAGHGALKAPRKFTRTELAAQIQKWGAGGSLRCYCLFIHVNTSFLIEVSTPLPLKSVSGTGR